VAGKTGTSQKVDPLTRGYSPDKRIASFGGFLPAEDPRLVILVVIDEPQGVKYGGVVAAPVFRQIAEEAVRYLGIPPSDLDASDRPAPVLAARTEVGGEEGMVLPASLVPPPEGKTLVPDLAGLDLRQALRVLSDRHLEARPVGSGVVAAQRPTAGSIVSPGASVEVELAPRG
jgi:cell division protein FtsI (penicillin-binding protein 3)